MRYILTILTLFQIINSLGQKTDNDFTQPFQTLYAENTKNTTGQSVKSLDMISIDDVLTIDNGGTISLIHYTGFPIELSTDTVVKVRDLQSLFNLSGKNQMPGRSTHISVKPSIEYLFISDIVKAKKHKLFIRGYQFDHWSKIDLLYPPLFSTQDLNYAQALCLRWTHTNTKSYQIELRDKSENIIKTYLSNDNELNINGEEIKTLNKNQKDLSLVIHEVEGKEYSEHLSLEEFKMDKIKFPYTCDLKKASLALMTGLYLELLNTDYSDEAEKYFNLATILSDKQFYKDMLENFKKRRER